MSDDRREMYLPQGPCADCLEHGINRTPAGIIWMHCPHHQVGGQYNEKLDRWTLVSPIDAAGIRHWLTERQTIRRGMVNMAHTMSEPGGPTH